MNELTQARAEELNSMFVEFSFHEEEPDREQFDKIDNPLELHFIACFYNWDDGEEVLEWIVNNPLCDQGTAKMIFWRSQPSFYTQFATADEADYESGMFELVRTIMDKLEQGFYRNAEIGYDPSNDPAAEETDVAYPNAKWLIPDQLKTVSPGAVPDWAQI